MKNYLECRSLVTQLMAWLKHFIILGVITFALAALFSSSWFITPLYRSTARIYPTGINAFSEESESEQMLEVISSIDIKRRMIDVFDLKERYLVKPDDRFAQTHVLHKYNKYITCSKTRYETIEISALDADPVIASAMVDSIVAFYNQKMLSMRRSVYGKQLVSFEKDMSRKQAQIDSLNNAMEHYRRDFGLLDYQNQVTQLTQGYTEVLARGGSEARLKEVQDRLDILAEEGGNFWQMEAKMNELLKQRDQISLDMERVYSLVNRDEDFAMVVEEAFPADKKAYPVRWLIVLVSVLAVEFMAMLLVLFIESNKSKKA